MARVTYVKRAQQRFQTTVVRDADGNPVRTPVMGRNGQQKQSKRGPVFRTVTTEDRSKPLPPYKCENCDKKIVVGAPYKWIAPKSGPYGGRKRIRCGDCPTWQYWDYSNSLAAQTARISHDFSEAIATADSVDEVTDALSTAAGEVRDIAEEKRTGAQNIESGFGHETEKSAELNDIAEQLDSWADEIENADVPEFPEPEEIDCEDCGGEGEVIDTDSNEEADDTESTPKVTCETCGGNGSYTPDEPTEDQIDSWRSEVQDSLTIVDECPV